MDFLRSGGDAKQVFVFYVASICFQQVFVFYPSLSTVAILLASGFEWFYEFLFVETWAVTKHSDSLFTFQS